MKKWKAATIGLLISTAIAGGALVDNCDNSLVVKNGKIKHITKDTCVTGDIDIDDKADWKNDKVLTLGNKHGLKQRLKPPKGKSMGKIVIGMSPAFIELGGDLLAESITINPEAVLDANGFSVDTKNMDIRGDFIPGEETKFHGNGTLYQTTKSKTVIDPASWAIEAVYSETGALLFETGALITATGSHIESWQDPIGNVIVAP